MSTQRRKTRVNAQKRAGKWKAPVVAHGDFLDGLLMVMRDTGKFWDPLRGKDLAHPIVAIYSYVQLQRARDRSLDTPIWEYSQYDHVAVATRGRVQQMEVMGLMQRRERPWKIGK